MIIIIMPNWLAALIYPPTHPASGWLAGQCKGIIDAGVFIHSVTHIYGCTSENLDNDRMRCDSIGRTFLPGSQDSTLIDRISDTHKSPPLAVHIMLARIIIENRLSGN
eukprot:GHVU01070090.1.p1 GENE.GHVU01070090.1~~GHVU01070090.1.p1  ORF type:complete len:108 (-),score=1.39 GHVU01070090.1:538-861(-)